MALQRRLCDSVASIKRIEEPFLCLGRLSFSVERWLPHGSTSKWRTPVTDGALCPSTVNVSVTKLIKRSCQRKLCSWDFCATIWRFGFLVVSFEGHTIIFPGSFGQNGSFCKLLRSCTSLRGQNYCRGRKAEWVMLELFPFLFLPVFSTAWSVDAIFVLWD